MGMGKRIRHFREKAGLKLQQLAALADVDTGTISALEVRDSARSQYFPVLAAAFGMTVEQLGDEAYDPELLVVTDKEAGWHSEVVRIYPKPNDDTERPQFSLAHASEPGPWADPKPAGFLGRWFTKDAAPAYGMTPILAWEHEDDLPDGEFVMVPRLDVKLSAGPGGGPNQVEIQFSQQQPQAFRADWVRQQRLKPKKLAAMIGSGDSMEPSIYHGDSLLVDTSQTEVLDGKVYALWYDGGERVKRLYRLPGGGLRIKSDNPAYDPIVLGPDYSGHVRIIGRVVHRSGTGGL